MNAFDALHQCCDEGKVDINTFPDARFRQNFAWFVDDTDTAPFPHGWCLDKRKDDPMLRKVLTDARNKALGSLRLTCEQEGQEAEWLIQALKSRALEGIVVPSSHDDELRMNATFASWLREDDEAHLLVRWLLEAEFLDAYKGESKTIPNKSDRYGRFERVPRVLPSNPTLSDALLLHFTSSWPAVSNPKGKHRMGPAGRLLTYWIRGEMLGSLPYVALMQQLPSQSEMKANDDETLILALKRFYPAKSISTLRQMLAQERVRVDGTVVRKENHLLTEGQCIEVFDRSPALISDFEVPDSEDKRTKADGTRSPSRLVRRARLHAVARTEVITHVDQHDGVVERWRLCDMTKSRFDHVLSESWSVNDASWSECAMRGLTEELDLTEPHQEDLDVVSIGGARFELRESGSMEGLMTLTLVQDFLAEIPETRSGLRDVQEVDGQNLPQKRFEIPDGGGAELAWAPALRADAHPSKAIKPFVEGQPLVGGHFYGVHYMSDEQKADPIHWMFGAAIAIHTANEPEDLFHEIRKDGDAEARLERLRHHPVGRFFLDDSDGLGLATIDRTGPIARRGSAKQIQWNAFSKALHPSQQNKLYGSLKPFFDVDLLPDWKVFLSIEDNMRRKAKSRLFDALGALCFHLYDAQEERHILQVLHEKQQALRGDEAAPHKRAQLLVHDAALALEPGPDSKAWKAYRGKLADLIEYLCTTQALSLRNSDGHLDVTNLVRGSSPSLPDATNSGEASATLLIRGDGSVVEDQGRGLDLSVWEEASKSLSSDEDGRAAAVENLRKKGAIQRRYR